LAEFRDAMAGTWVGTMENDSNPGVLNAVEVAFTPDGAVKGTLEASGARLFSAGTYTLDGILDTCDAKGSLSFVPFADSLDEGYLWWVRPCGSALFFAYSSRSAGLRIVETYRLERQ
jgi:hypothetical protein